MSASEKILSKINTLRYKNPLFFTNAYIGMKGLIRILENTCAEIYETDDAVAVRFDDNNVRRLYIFAKSVEAAAGFVLPQQEDITIFEVIERDNSANTIGLFESNGWRVYSRLTQMSHVLRERVYTKTNCSAEVAGPRDTDALYTLLYEIFDFNISHLPTKNQLSDCISNKEVLIIRGQTRIAAAAIFNITGKKTKYLFQLFVDAAYHGQNYAQSLIDFEFSRSDMGTLYSLWVVADYTPAINLYKKAGFGECGRYLTVLSMGGVCNG